MTFLSLQTLVFLYLQTSWRHCLRKEHVKGKYAVKSIKGILICGVDWFKLIVFIRVKITGEIYEQMSIDGSAPLVVSKRL